MSPLQEARARVDAIDRELVRLLCERRRAVDELARSKAELGLPAIDREREAELREAWAAAAREGGLPVEHALAVLEAVLTGSRARVASIFARDGSSEQG